MQPKPNDAALMALDFNLPPRYQFIRVLGKGAYGVVGQFKDLESEARANRANQPPSEHDNHMVAIKKIHLNPAFADESQKIAEYMKILRELTILHKFRHPNIIGIKHVIVENSSHGIFLYLVTRLMAADLQRVIARSELTDEHVKYIMYQIFKGLNFLHKGHVLHRDIKPNNILATENCEIVLCDLGFARDTQPFNDMMTEYVYTRIYRAPEIVLYPKHYTEQVDIWAVGCTFYELMTKTNLLKAKDYKDLIVQIVNLLGEPSEEDLDYIKDAGARNFVMCLKRSPAGHFEQKVAKYPNKEAIDLLRLCLLFNPKKRISAEQALRHPYFSAYFDEEDLKVNPPTVDFSFETNHSLKAHDLVRMIMQEIRAINEYAGEKFEIPNV